MLNQFVFVYLDDILVFSQLLPQHIQRVRQVLERLLENQLYVKAEKWEFHQNKVSCLGHVITSERHQMYDLKVKAVTDWPTPTS